MTIAISIMQSVPARARCNCLWHVWVAVCVAIVYYAVGASLRSLQLSYGTFGLLCA